MPKESILELTIRPVLLSSRLCAGITSCSPLFRHNIGKGSKVGVVGLGGLGHYAVLFAKALGAEVVVSSPRSMLCSGQAGS